MKSRQNVKKISVMTTVNIIIKIISFDFNLFIFTSDLFPLYGFLNHETNAKTAIGAVIPKQVIISP